VLNKQDHHANYHDQGSKFAQYVQRMSNGSAPDGGVHTSSNQPISKTIMVNQSQYKASIDLTSRKNQQITAPESGRMNPPEGDIHLPQLVSGDQK
jgi:hypothetical protein